MPSIENSSKDHLNRMVRGAGRQLSRGRKPKTGKSTLAPAVYEQISSQIEKNGKSIQKIPLNLIRLNDNIREQYDQASLQTLANSIAKDGLIQFPTLCIRKLKGGSYALVCRNGHRRILAAKELGWTHIECVIVPFSSLEAELYHTINANLREDVFYLDLAHAYEEASRMGESDQSIAERVGVNVRTVGWYRRLVKMSENCAQLCRSHPDIFTATWAIKMARRGELPPNRLLEPAMHEMIKAKKSWIPSFDENESDSQKKPEDPVVKKKRQLKARRKLKDLSRKPEFEKNRELIVEVLDCMAKAGFLGEASWKRLQKDLLTSI